MVVSDPNLEEGMPACIALSCRAWTTFEDFTRLLIGNAVRTCRSALAPSAGECAAIALPDQWACICSSLFTAGQALSNQSSTK